MKVTIYTPTMRPGLDVTYFSVQRQKCKADIQWILCDELLDQRIQTLQNLMNGGVRFTPFKIPVLEGYKRNLARANTIAMEMARAWKSDLFIILQDYIYIPEDGVQKFIDVAREVSGKAIFTGICSITADPEPDKIYDPGGGFTIFEQPYKDKPQQIEWMDVRFRNSVDLRETTPIEWEANWAAIPRKALYDKALFYNPELDRGSRYDNQDYAFRAASEGYRIIIDDDNQSLSLPHKKYFPEEWVEDQELADPNRKLIEQSWGH